jgi:hypothetical protein
MASYLYSFVLFDPDLHLRASVTIKSKNGSTKYVA